MNAADAARESHPEYTAGAVSFLLNGEVQIRRGIIVQCPTVDHHHTTGKGVEVKAKTVLDPEVGLSWVVTAYGPEGITAMEAAYQSAQALGELLHLPLLREA